MLLAVSFALLLSHASVSALEGTDELSAASESLSALSGQWTSFWGKNYKFLDVAGTGLAH